MPCDNHGPFPFGAVQDLLAITRALYRASPQTDRSRRLKRIGEALRASIDLARASGEGTLGRRAAWSKAEAATAELGELVADGVTVETLVVAAAAKIRRAR
jgi:hypothetical protein